MSKYGYNPDEHFQTKVTLIDKDGFHKESDEVPGGGNSGTQNHTFMTVSSSGDVYVHIFANDLQSPYNLEEIFNAVFYRRISFYTGETKDLQYVYTDISDLNSDLGYTFTDGVSNISSSGHQSFDLDGAGIELNFERISYMFGAQLDLPETITDDTIINFVLVYATDPTEENDTAYYKVYQLSKTYGECKV